MLSKLVNTQYGGWGNAGSHWHQMCYRYLGAEAVFESQNAFQAALSQDAASW